MSGNRQTSRRPAPKAGSGRKPKRGAAKRATSTEQPRQRSAQKRAARRRMFRRTTSPRHPRNRLAVVLLAFAMVGAGFVALLVDLQAVRSDDLRSLGEDQRTGTRQLAGYRGSIVDRNGFVLAVSTPSHRVEADPTMIVDRLATASVLAPLLGIDAAVLAEQLTPESENDRYALLARPVTDDVVTGISDLRSGRHADHLIGVFVRPEEDRVYPAPGLAVPIVGRVDPDERGIYGIESMYDEAMTGQPGWEQYERSRFGSISVTDWKVDPAVAGYDVMLTIDHRIQYVTEEALRAQCESTRARSAMAVITEPASGQILAMATVERDDETGRCVVPRHNATLVWTFEPGSVLKTITMAAAIEELGYDGSTLVDVPPRVSIGGKDFVDQPPHPAAPYPLSQILADSMNVGTIQVAQQLGPTQVHSYLNRFGFGHSTGIGFEGEARGSVRDPDDWWGSDAGSIPIGQGVLVNATQLVAAYNAIAAGGHYRSPTLVAGLVDPSGVEHPVDLDPAIPVVSERTAAELTAMLSEVVRDGTGRPAAVDGYTVAGKTGTAWKAFDDGSGQLTYGSNTNRRYVATFAGFVPADDPALSMVVVVDEPETRFTASAVAAPVFAEVAQYSLRILGIQPSAPAGVIVAGERVRAVPAQAPDAEAGGAEEVASAGPGIDPTEPAQSATIGP
jgi:cell division protein FtsI (penicillin-binding protein 3)